jgi:hypothetical protein
MTEPQNRSGRGFEDELHAYLNWVGPRLVEAGLVWDEVVVAECDGSSARISDGATDPARHGPVRAPERFAVRFSEILDDVARGWVNLTAATIEDRRLIVVVEWISRPRSENEGPPARPVAVNWSGMGFAEIARLTRR